MRTKPIIRFITCFIITLFIYNQKINSQCISPVIYPRIGVNLDLLGDNTPSRYFTDFAKESNLRDLSWNYYCTSNPADPFNASGWPATSFYIVHG